MVKLKRRDSIDLSQELKTIRDSIDNINLEGVDNMSASAKKPPLKKKAATPTAVSGSKIFSLHDLCKKAKIEARVARRRLRAADIKKPDGGQWEWSKAQEARILKIISG